MDRIYRNMQDDTEMLEEIDAQSQIKEFYTGKTIFLTGCTGFIGISLVEKLLRSCIEIKHIYGLVRAKKSKTPEERLKEFFANSIFDRLRKENPEFTKKMTVIEGDLTAEGLGLSAESRRLIAEETDIMIHSAANVGFFSPLSKLLKSNVIGTQMILELARECKRLKCFVYVSTAFAYSPDPQNVKEELIPTTMDIATVQCLIKLLDAGLRESAIELPEEKFRNMYCLSKAICEGVVNEFKKTVSFPCVLYRPTVVQGSYREPVPGWASNLNGANMLSALYLLGFLHIAVISPSSQLDIIPLDCTVNSLLALIWYTTVHESESPVPIVYNYGCTYWNRTSNAEMTKIGIRCAHENPSAKMLWLPWVFFTQHFPIFIVLHFIFHVIPAAFVDLFLLLQKGKPRVLMTLWKLNPYMQRLARFTMADWRIEAKNIKRVWDSMNYKDHQMFPCDVRTLDWEDYLPIMTAGIREYAIKEPLTNMPAAIKRYRLFFLLHYSILGLVLYFLLRSVFAYIF